MLLTDLYLAYGSNLSSARMRERVASAQTLGVARLEGWRLACDKRGRDGSGKANIVPDGEAVVWGVVYRIEPDEWTILDRFERGYERVRVEARIGDDDLDVQTYASRRLTGDPVPYDWYKALLLAGAREHGLPREYVARLACLPERPDPARASSPSRLA